MMPSNIYNPSSGIQFAWCRQRNHDRTARSLALSCVLYLISFGFISSRGITRCAPIEAMSSMALPAMFFIDTGEKEAAIVHVALDLFPAFVQGCLGTQDQPGLRTVLSAIDDRREREDEVGALFLI